MTAVPARTTPPRASATSANAPRPPKRTGTAAAAGTHGSWFVSIALVLVVASATLLVRPAFATANWGPEAVLMAAVVIGASALVRTFTGGVLWPSLAGLAGFVGVLTVRLAPESLGDVGAAWGRTGLALIDQFASDAPPFRETDASVIALLAIVGVVAMTCDLFVFGLRGRVSAVLPVLVFPILPVALGVVEIDVWPTIWLAGAFALYLFATAWWHQRVADDRLADAGYLVDDRGMSGWFGALGTAAAGLVIAIVVSFALPSPTGISAIMPNPGASLSTNRANPMLDLGDDLRRSEAVPVLEYATSITEGALPYLSLVTLVELDGGSEWAPGDFSADATTEGGAELPAPAGVAANAPVVSFGANLILEPGVSAYLPHPGQAVSIQGLSTVYGIQGATGDLRELEDEALAQHYEYRGTRLSVSTEVLAAAQTSVPAGFESLVELPGGPAADQIRGELEKIVDATASPLAQAEQVRATLAGDTFTYSESSPVAAGYDGSNLDVTAAFLEARSGYCVHFSSAMAVMARMLGIPARIQVGFTPGTPTSVNAQGQVVYQVTSDDLHAWAELWVDGYGWVPFEATPASGIGQAFAPDPASIDENYVPPVEQPESTPGEGGGAQPIEPEPSETPEPEATQDAETGPDQVDDTEPDSAAWLAPLLIVAAIVLALAVLLACIPVVVRTMRRASRRRRVLAGDPRAAAIAWREITDEAVDHGAGVPRAAEIRRQESLLLRLLTAEPVGDDAAHDGERASDAVVRLREGVERAAFDRPDAARKPVDWADVELVEGAMRAASPRARRIRAVLRPASLPLLRGGIRQRLRRALRRGSAGSRANRRRA